MKCPRCSRSFSFLESVKILNPWKHRRPACEAVLTAGWQALVAYMLAAVLGLAVAGIAIAMEETGVWSGKGSVLWFVTALPVACALYLLCCWKWVSFKERECNLTPQSSGTPR
jgi:hypothetical protein